MAKKDIVAMSDTDLIAHAMVIESISTKEENSRGVTQSVKKDYMWTVEELARRFNLDFDELIKKIGAYHWWDKE